MSYFYIGQEVSGVEVAAFNDAEFNAAKRNCLNAFLRDVKVRANNNGYVYTQDPGDNYINVYKKCGKAKIVKYKSSATRVETETEKETEYTSSGYTGTISGSSVEIRENIDSQTVYKTRVSSVESIAVFSDFYYVFCKPNDVSTVINYVNKLAKHNEGYENAKKYSVSDLSWNKISAIFIWIIGLLGAILDIYMVFPLLGKISLYETAVESENNIFAWAAPQAPVFWPIFSACVILTIAQLVLISNRPIKESDYSRFRIIGSILLPLLVIAEIVIFIAFDKPHEEVNAFTSWTAFGILIAMAIIAIVKPFIIIPEFSHVKETNHAYNGIKMFARIYGSLECYEQDIAYLTKLLL